MSATETATRVALVDGCGSPLCLKMGAELQLQLEGYQRGAAIMPIPATIDDWRAEHRTARRRALHAKRNGYHFATIDRRDYELDILRVNRSKPERQGRPMGAGYHERPRYGANPIGCPRHHVYTYAILQGRHERLVAYLWLYRSGQLAMISSILGHAEHLHDGIMYRLFEGMLEQQRPHGGTVFYNLWRSGQDGLRWFKTRVGLEEGNVEWAL